MLKEISLTPVGIVHSELVHRYETPRQGVLSDDIISTIKLFPHRNYQYGLKDLDGFDRLWVIYVFHKNKTWKPLVHPPRHLSEKIGVFATRSPFRPNPVGLSCVKIVKIEGLNIFITGSDILDGSPVLDIKPYIPWYDSFPDIRTGWVKNNLEERYEITASGLFSSKAEKIKQDENANLLRYAKVQLEFEPDNLERKRLASVDESKNLYSLKYREWQIIYEIINSGKSVLLLDIVKS